MGKREWTRIRGREWTRRIMKKYAAVVLIKIRICKNSQNNSALYLIPHTQYSNPNTPFTFYLMPYALFIIASITLKQ